MNPNGLEPIFAEASSAYRFWLESDASYECSYCETLYQSEAFLFLHLESVHKVPKEKYIGHCPDYIRFRRSEICQICQVFSGDVFAHLKKDHSGISKEVYFLRFVFQPANQIPERAGMALKNGEGKQVSAQLYKYYGSETK